MKQSKYYNNINGVLKMAIEISDIETIQEILKCRQDPIYFLRKYFYINNQESFEEILLDLYDYQEDAINRIYDKKRLLLNWSRQASKTTVATAFILHFTLFNKNKNSFLLANKFETSREILERIKFAYCRLPEFLQCGVIEFNKSSLIFANGSKIFASTTSPDSIRGKSASIIYVDECAFCDHWDVFWSGIAPTIAANKNGYVILTSTPNGFNHFYHMVTSARQKTNGFELSEVKWFDVPGRDEAWRIRALADLGNNENRFAQEYELQFLGASGCLISSDALRSLQIAEMIETRLDTCFRIYDLPEKDEKYFLFCDFGEGVGNDESVIQVLKQIGSKFRQVAVYSDDFLKPREFAGIIHHIGTFYNTALVVGESNSIGKEALNELFITYEYENCFFDLEKKNEIGLRQTKKTKKLGCSYLKKMIESEVIDVIDQTTINQISTFVLKGESYEATQGNHDDHVMPLVVFAALMNNENFINYWVESYDMRENDKRFESADILPVLSNYSEFDD